MSNICEQEIGTIFGCFPNEQISSTVCWGVAFPQLMSCHGSYNMRSVHTSFINLFRPICMDGFPRPDLWIGEACCTGSGRYCPIGQYLATGRINNQNINVYVSWLKVDWRQLTYRYAAAAIDQATPARSLTLAPLGAQRSPLWFFANNSWSTGNFAFKLAIPPRATIPHIVSKN